MNQQKRLLAIAVDDHAKHNPSNIFAVIPQGSELSHGFRSLTMKDLAHAVNGMCWWIEGTIGLAQSPETLAYMGSNDVRYFVFMLACQKTGYQAFLPSTRNSDEAHLHLLKVIDCTKFFFSEERRARALEIQGLSSKALELFQVPALKTVLNEEPGLRYYPYNKSFADAENDTICIIHSSGTTGMPKPVYLTNGFFMTLDSLSNLQWPAGRIPAPFFHLGQEDLVLSTTPFFHLMGLMALIFTVWFDVPVLIGPEKPLSVDHMVGLMQIGRPTLAMCPPSVLEDMSYSDEALSCVKNLKSVLFGGAPLAPDVGDRLRQHTTVVTVIGTSEIGWIASMVPEDPANWGYFEWNDTYGVDMQDIGEGMFEMVIPRQPDARDFKGIFHTYPDISEYHTNDLYTRHPTHPRLWKFHGRKDDVIVLSNGEKFNPVGMETIIEGHPLVDSAVVVGQSRFQAGLLIELNHDVPDMDTKLFIEQIWPTVQVANSTIAGHGRVMKNRIGIAPKTKAFKKTPKGTVQRRTVLREFEEEIDAIYAQGMDDEFDQDLPESLDSESVTKFIRQTIARVLEKEIFSTQDFFSAGLDSLLAIQVSRMMQKIIELRPGVKAAITAQTIYANPTIEKLSTAVLAMLEGKSQAEIPREKKLHYLVKKYTSDLPVRKVRHNELQAPTTVILTGSTGSLGNYLLHRLLSSESISKVYCLNRSDAVSRQQKGFEEKGLSLDNWNKAEFLQASFGAERFGLDGAKYQELVDSVDTIIHNAWKVDFNHTVDSFEDTHIQGVRRFVDFSLSSRNNAHIHFVSSVSTVGAWTPEMGSSIPEEPMDSNVVLSQGYGESKHVAERICLEASRRSDVPTTVYRVGQIAGPTSRSGQWNPHEWLPMIIATSKAMGKIPTRLGSMPVDWVPVDTLSAIMVEIVNTRHRSSDLPWAVFHLTNPEAAPWSSLIPAVQEQYPVEPVDFAAWVADLESISNPSSADLASKPALKLLSFYRGLLDEGGYVCAVGCPAGEKRQS
ncbi:hypothetical protein N7508_004562 [Penicillium antarcticum]|uniref:uncharacterized protein n=1 Tax=Penicillium antarcticum TaxID=416450 RepID=UPI00239843B0|nr:uncharacterized protein N7508_004562 [Penicillium antarcticum]KAJ5309183.1 hypothetical protein N7508_004562 [Penicillium antarcticum]